LEWLLEGIGGHVYERNYEKVAEMAQKAGLPSLAKYIKETSDESVLSNELDRLVNISFYPYSYNPSHKKLKHLLSKLNNSPIIEWEQKIHLELGKIYEQEEQLKETGEHYSQSSEPERAFPFLEQTNMKKALDLAQRLGDEKRVEVYSALV